MPSAPQPESVSILIDGKNIGGWDELEVTNALDAFSTASFTAPFEPERKEFRETFRPFSFKPVRVFVGDDAVFTGRLVDINPSIEPNKRSVAITAMALPGVFEDCTAPGATVPHEFKKLTIREIAQALLAPFEIDLDLRGSPGDPFKKVKIEEGQKLVEFISELAKQRTLVLSNTVDGALLCWGSIATGNPVATLVGDQPPISIFAGSFSPQEYFSEITGFASARRGKGGSKFTEKNPFLTDVLRPHSFRLDDTEKGDAPQETRARLGRMFANVASYTAENIPTWRDPQGDLWAPNTTAIVTAPNAMVYRQTELLIRRVKLQQSAQKYTAALEFCLPGAFSAEIPERLPWDD